MCMIIAVRLRSCYTYYMLCSKFKKKTDYSLNTLKHLHLLQPEHWNKQLHCTKNCVMRHAIQYELFCSHADRTCLPTLIHLALLLFAKSLAYMFASRSGHVNATWIDPSFLSVFFQKKMVLQKKSICWCYCN